MFRVTSLVLRRNGYKVPLLSQCATTKQLIVEFSIVPCNKEKLQQKEAPVTITESNKEKSETPSPLLQHFYNEKILREFQILGKNESLKEVVLSSGDCGPNEILQILKAMAESQNRSTRTLNKICSLIEKNQWVFSLSGISDILYCFARLSYKNESTIAFLTEPIKKGAAIGSPKIISSILHSFGCLRYRDCELLELLLKSMLTFPLDIKNSLQCLLSLTFLNYPCDHAQPLIKFLSELNETDYYQTNDYINFVWACVILNQIQYISGKHLSRILSDEYLSKATLPNFHPGIHLKLLNILAAAQCMTHETSGEILKKPPPHIVSKLQKKTSFFFNSVVDALTYILPKSGYFKTLVNTGAGFYLDVQYTLTSKKAPVEADKATEMNKMGLLLLEYKELCSDNTPTGIFDFKKKLLEKQNYNIVVINQVEYPINSSISEKVDYLRQKIYYEAGSENLENTKSNS